MTGQSPSELERDAERVRAEIADTAEHLKDKMSPGQLMDEVVDYFKDGDTNQLLSNLKHQVRDNPLALALVGSGLAWLMMGSGPATDGRHAGPRSRPHGGGRTTPRPAGNGTDYAGASSTASTARDVSGSSGIASSITKGAAEARDAAGDAVERVSEAVGSATDSASAALHDIRDTASQTFDSVANAGADLGARAKNTFLDALEREPLVIGALGVAVGAAIGAMLPATRTEQEYLGATSVKARETAEAALSDGIDKATHVAKDVYSAARDEADRQGLTARDKPIAEKVADVAKAAGSELKAAADHSIHQAEETVDKATDTLSPGSKQKT